MSAANGSKGADKAPVRIADLLDDARRYDNDGQPLPIDQRKRVRA